MKTIEDEMRIDLRFQRAQFCIAREDLRFKSALLGALRSLDGDQHVEKPDRQEIEQHSQSENERGDLGNFRLQRGEIIQAGESRAERARQEHPEATGDDRGDSVRHDQRRDARSLQRISAARVPSGEAHESVEQAQRRDQRDGFAPAESRGGYK